ncbi:MAG: efflux RND transporter periplasmic adaptor subunit [Acidimicrobiales bacterium]
MTHPIADPAGARRARQARQRRHRLVGGAAVVVVGVAVALVVSETGASGATGYRTATASYQTVRQILAVTGDVVPVKDRTAAFQVPGTVAAVDVQPGQQVTAGQRLAALATSALSENVQSAQLALDGAQAALAENEANEASGSSGSGSSASGSASHQAATSAATTGASGIVLTSATEAPRGSSGSDGSLQSDQQAVVDTQKTVDSDTGTAKAALAQAQTACSSTSTGEPTTNSTTPSTTTSTTPPTSGDQSGSASGGASPANACTQALQAAFTAEQRVSTDEGAASGAEDQLAQLLATEASSLNKSESNGVTTPGRTASSGGTTSSSGSKPTSTTGASSVTQTDYDSAQQLASDQATIDSDEAALVEAQQELADATLVAPFSGTVAAVSLTPGQMVGAGSSDGVTIVDTSSFEVTSSLTSSQVPSVAVGDDVEVTVDGLSATLTGRVTQVGPVEQSSDNYVYPVEISVDPPAGQDLRPGSAAQAQIVIGQASHALAVPTSAVHTTGVGDSYVIVIEGGKEAQKRVRVGVVSLGWTQVTSGLQPGDKVVLADLSESLPSSSTNASSARFARTGGAGFLRVGTPGKGLAGGGGFQGGGRGLAGSG